MTDNSTWWILIGLLFVGLVLFVVRLRAKSKWQREMDAEIDKFHQLRVKARPAPSKADDLSSLLQQATKTDNPRAKTPSEQWRGTGNARRNPIDDGGVSIHSPLHPHSPFSSAHHDSGSYSSGCSSSSSDSSSSSSSSSSCD